VTDSVVPLLWLLTFHLMRAKISSLKANERPNEKLWPLKEIVVYEKAVQVTL